MPKSKISEIFSLLNVLTNTEHTVFDNQTNLDLDLDIILSKLKELKNNEANQSLIINQLEIANKEIIESKKRLIEAQKIAKIGSWEYNTLTNQTTWSKELYRIFEIDETDQDFIESFKSKIHSEDVNIFESIFSFDPKETYRSKNFRIICHKEIKYILATIYSSFEKGISSQTLGTFQDITAQKIAIEKEKKLEQLEIQHKRKLIEAILLTKEKEQKRIAEELHDDIGSSLMVLKIAIHQMNISESEKNILYQSITDLVGKVRNLSNELSPNILEEFGIINALKHLINSISNLTKLNISISSNVDEIDLLSKEEQLSLYRVIQELLNNIIKYASAENIQISLEFIDSEINIKILDDGNGFIPNQTNRSKTTLGLLNIESRIEYINATIKYSLLTPRGTEILITKYIQKQ